ncbi:hypothetical protein K490DRAFT_54862 [Saccharata proteae CBS 121410]|uniref:Myb-like domain-containing protein n=1 Tax=Saccharata proteae CBS 121410 TaxID=1314787 RepID=A0A6A5YCN7_9PEZI|nr:hypothetical protein K490DRAFT_54862 [Saccharata proteae CBS 121410]
MLPKGSIYCFNINRTYSSQLSQHTTREPADKHSSVGLSSLINRRSKGFSTTTREQPWPHSGSFTDQQQHVGYVQPAWGNLEGVDADMFRNIGGMATAGEDEFSFESQDGLFGLGFPGQYDVEGSAEHNLRLLNEQSVHPRGSLMDARSREPAHIGDGATAETWDQWQGPYGIRVSHQAQLVTPSEGSLSLHGPGQDPGPTPSLTTDASPIDRWGESPPTHPSPLPALAPQAFPPAFAQQAAGTHILPANAQQAEGTLVQTAPSQAGGPRQNRRDRIIGVGGVIMTRDQYLVAARRRGDSYEVIKRNGGFAEKVSTLRGRYRSLTKAKEERVRKPAWTEANKRLLLEGVMRHRDGATTGADQTTSTAWMATVDIGKVKWKNVVGYMVSHRGYSFGLSACKKQFVELRTRG